MANLNDTMASGRGTKWRNKIGNELTTGDIVDEIKSDAIFMELENFDNGASLFIFCEYWAGSSNRYSSRLVGKLGEELASLVKSH